MDNTKNKGKRFVYFYFNRNQPEKIRQVVPAHVRYWEMANLRGYVGGPFADRSGGLISFAASSPEEAAAIILQDPFILEDLIAERWIREWIVDE